MSSNLIITIHVTYDEETGTLTLDQPHIDLPPKQAVQWLFSSNTPGHALPHAVFQPVAGQPFPVEGEQFGPFQYLEARTHTLTALGNIGKHFTYHYTLLLLDENGPLATSKVPISINNQGVEDTSPDALITYHPDDPDPEKQLIVSPPSLRVQPGRTVIWYIKGIPLGHFVTFRFLNSPHPLTGPFSSFSVSRGFGNAWLANGADIRFPDEQHPLISYHVTVRDALGNLVAWDDPTIEPLGPPPNTGG